jgi:hypothetical protein
MATNTVHTIIYHEAPTPRLDMHSLFFLGRLAYTGKFGAGTRSLTLTFLIKLDPYSRKENQ